MAMHASGRLPDDVATLKAVIEHERATHTTALSARDEEIERLRAQMRLLLAQRFGASSERVAHAGQLGLFNEAEAEADVGAQASEDDPADLCTQCVNIPRDTCTPLRLRR